MRILLCNNTLSLLAGSETATYSMAVELKRLGHEVSAFSFHLGAVSDKMKEKGIEVMDDLEGKRDAFDVVFANHFDPTCYIKAKCPNTPIVFTVHGIIGGPEEPPLFCDAFVAVSEEVQAHVKKQWMLESTIIRNAVDLERFKEVKPRDPEIKNVLISSSYYGQNSEVFKAIFDACAVMNATVHATGKDFKWVWGIEEIYNNVDLVITLGRGCLEAMACNRPAIVIGHWGKNQELSSDGIITDKSIKEIRKSNFSSRAIRNEIGTKEIVDLIDAVKKHGKDYNYRQLVEKDHDIKASVSQYLAIAAKILPDGEGGTSRKEDSGTERAGDSSSDENRAA